MSIPGTKISFIAHMASAGSKFICIKRRVYHNYDNTLLWPACLRMTNSQWPVSRYDLSHVEIFLSVILKVF